MGSRDDRGRVVVTSQVMDVASAVYSGADCVMLSGESAKGMYYKESIEAMSDIIREVRTSLAAHLASARRGNKKYIYAVGYLKTEPSQPPP